MFDLNAQLSTNYLLKHLTITNYALSSPNLPDQSYQFDNLTMTADMLERLEYEIGPFQIVSAFRTKELQGKLSASGEPTGSGAMSFHEAGRAVDIYPTTMSIADYFGLILANEGLRDSFAEIAIKPEQNALHLAINVPGDVRAPKITGLADGSYQLLDTSEIAEYIDAAIEKFGEVGSAIASNKMPIIVIGVGLAAVTALLLLSKKASA